MYQAENEEEENEDGLVMEELVPNRDYGEEFGADDVSTENSMSVFPPPREDSSEDDGKAY